jgi:hypothetical protein
LQCKNVRIRLYIAVIFPGVVYVYAIWSLTLREEHRLRVTENRVLRGILGPKRDEVMGGWRKLCDEELHNLYTSPIVITMIKSVRIRWTWHVSWMREKGMLVGLW